MKNSASKGIFFLSLSSIIYMISGYVANIWLGRYLGPKDYGTYGVILSLISFVNFLQSAGLTQSVSKYVAENKHDSEAILKTGLVLQIISTVTYFSIFFFFSEQIAWIFRDYSLGKYIKIASFVFIFYGIYALYSDYYNGLHFFKKQSTMNIIYSLTRTLIVLALAYLYQLKGVFYGFIVAPFLALLYGFHFPKAKLTFSYKKLVLFSIPLIGLAFFFNLMLSGDLLLLKILSGSVTDPGYYTASQNIARIPLFSMSALILVIFPSISKSVSNNDIKKTLLLIHQAVRVTLLLVIPSILIISSTSKQLLTLLYSSAYIPASNSLSILAIAMGFSTIFTVLSYILSGGGKPKLSMIISGIGLLLSGIFCVQLIPIFGLVGAALSTTIGSFVAMILAAYFVFREFKTLVSLLTIFKIITTSLVIYIIAKLIFLPSAYLLPILYVFLFGVYFGILVLLKEITYKDWLLVSEFLPKRFQFKK